MRLRKEILSSLRHSSCIPNRKDHCSKKDLISEIKVMKNEIYWGKDRYGPINICLLNLNVIYIKPRINFEWWGAHGTPQTLNDLLLIFKQLKINTTIQR